MAVVVEVFLNTKPIVFVSVEDAFTIKTLLFQPAGVPERNTISLVDIPVASVQEAWLILPMAESPFSSPPIA